jgi:predicted anti-sigma-YlaC factor YlaD
MADPDRLILAAMLLPPVAMVLFGVGIVARCLNLVGMEATIGSISTVAAASLIFGAAMAWGIAAVLMDQDRPPVGAQDRRYAD